MGGLSLDSRTCVRGSARGRAGSPLRRGLTNRRAAAVRGVVAGLCVTVGVDISIANLSAHAAAPVSSGAPGQVARALTAFRAGDYDKAARLFDGLPARVPRIRDYALYYAGESDFFAGRPRVALARFKELERDRASRFASYAGLRVADCLWSAGDKVQAVALYRKAFGASAEGERPSPKLDRARQNAFIAGGGLVTDPVVGRFRIAEFLATGGDANQPLKKPLPDPSAIKRAARAYEAIHLEFPAHPLADEAGRRARALAPEVASAVAVGGVGGGDKPVIAAGAGEAAVAAVLKRAEALGEGRRFEEAVKELEGLPASLPTASAAERDYLLGMTKFRMRRDYGDASKLLLAAEPHLSGDKAATAAFHGVRALSRVHRDDDAIVGYRRFVGQYGGNRYAAEASFLAGWLDFNRGRYREALPGFDETVRRFPRTSFAADAAWFTALGQLLLGQGQASLEALDRFARMGGQTGAATDTARRVGYFRARALLLLGRKAEAQVTLTDLATKAPFSYYGLIARARLRTMGVPLPVSLPALGGRGTQGEAKLADPLLARTDDLQAAGLSVDAGAELLRGESGLLARRGRDRAIPGLMERYTRYGAYRRAYQLAEMHGDAALASAPTGAARGFWTAAYPRAFRDLVEKYGPETDNPELFVYAIMRKESGYLPSEVSYADARGLMQLLPELGARLAQEIGVDFSEEQLFLPEVNLRLGARYTGGLASKFRGSLALAAGAYNAGGRAVVRWCDANGKRPLDEFVELVSFDDTREYIKRVLAIYARYHYLYKERAFEPDLEGPGCRYDPAGREN